MQKRKYDFQTIMLLIILFLSNIGIMGTTVYAIVMTEMYANLDEWAINLTIALPGVVGLVACLAAGKLADKMDKKAMFIAGLVLFAISGSVFGGLLMYSNMGQVIAACINGGICYGMVSVSSIGLITDCFQDEEQRSKVMGWYNGAMAAVGAVLSLVYGVFAVRDWSYAFQVNWVALVIAVLAVFFVPACPPQKNAASAQSTEAVKGEKGWANRLIPILLAFFFVSLAYMTVLSYIDLYVSANNLGDAAFTGLFGSVGTVCSFVACSSFGYTYKVMKTKITLPGYALITLGILVLYLAPGRTIALVTSGIMGFAWGTVYTYWFFRSTVVVPENMIGTATGLVTTANSLSYFPMPYILTFLMAAMGTDNVKNILPFYVALMAVVLVIAVIYKAANHKEDAKEAA
jgi:predicted MFS family arabinose efflux permease